MLKALVPSWKQPTQTNYTSKLSWVVDQDIVNQLILSARYGFIGNNRNEIILYPHKYIPA